MDRKPLRYNGPGQFQGPFGAFQNGDVREVSARWHAYALSAYPDWFEDAGGPDGTRGEGDAPPPAEAPPRTKPFRPRKK